MEDLISEGKIQNSDIVGEVHCMHPNFLQAELELSLQNLKVDTLDLYYLHNAAESQLALVGDQVFYERLARALEFLEEKRQEGKIQNYGLATWNCFRSPPWEEGVYVSLEKIVKLAEEVCGADHGLRYIQVPMNTLMYEAYSCLWQTMDKEMVEKDMR